MVRCSLAGASLAALVAACGTGETPASTFGVPTSGLASDTETGDDPTVVETHAVSTISASDPTMTAGEDATMTRGSDDGTTSDTSGPVTATLTTDPGTTSTATTNSLEGSSTGGSVSMTGATTSTTSGSSMSTTSAGETGACVPEPGTFGDCVSLGAAVCENPASTCLQDNVMDPMLSVCALPDCVDECDCPAAPATGDAPVTCGAIVMGGGNACYLDCSGAATCPDGMECLANTACLWPVTSCPGGGPAGDYADCLTGSVLDCNNPDAVCVVDDPMAATQGVCVFQDCVDSCDCPDAPAGSEAQPSCAPILDGGATNACFLDCSGGDACPAGMSCLDDFICVW